MGGTPHLRSAPSERLCAASKPRLCRSGLQFAAKRHQERRLSRCDVTPPMHSASHFAPNLVSLAGRDGRHMRWSQRRETKCGAILESTLRPAALRTVGEGAELG